MLFRQLPFPRVLALPRVSRIDAAHALPPRLMLQVLIRPRWPSTARDNDAMDRGKRRSLHACSNRRFVDVRLWCEGIGSPDGLTCVCRRASGLALALSLDRIRVAIANAT